LRSGGQQCELPYLSVFVGVSAQLSSIEHDELRTAAAACHCERTIEPVRFVSVDSCHVQDQVANLVGSKDGQKPILAGAVVEGPQRKAESGAPRGVAACPPDGSDPFSEFNDGKATYKDNAKFYSTNEPGIDLTAPSFLVFVWKIAGAPSRIAFPNTW
jgi:hypothetical protein